MLMSAGSASSSVRLFGIREPQVVLLMTYGFCTAAGFQAFTFSAVVFPCGFAVLFGMVSVSIRMNRASWDAKKPEGDEVSVGGEDAGSGGEESCRESCLRKAGLLAGIPMRLVNFVLQVTLVTYSVGDLWGMFGLWSG